MGFKLGSIGSIGLPTLGGAVAGGMAAGPWGALAGAALAGGTAFGQYQNSKDIRAANDMNYKIAQDNTKFQETMSNTAYQRGMADMQAAGLNKMLAFSQGGASSPQGSTATMQAEQTGNALIHGSQSAAQAANTLTDIQKKGSEVSLNNAAATSEVAKRAQMLSSAKEADQRALKAKAETAALEANFDNVKDRAKFEQEQRAIDKKYMEYDSIADRAEQGTGILSNALGILMGKTNLFKQLGINGEVKAKTGPRSKTQHRYDRNGEYQGSIETNYKE